jgi:hypothetical protein
MAQVLECLLSKLKALAKEGRGGEGKGRRKEGS